jgi:hypothetical protein
MELLVILSLLFLQHFENVDGIEGLFDPDHLSCMIDQSPSYRKIIFFIQFDKQVQHRLFMRLSPVIFLFTFFISSCGSLLSLSTISAARSSWFARSMSASASTTAPTNILSGDRPHHRSHQQGPGCYKQSRELPAGPLLPDGGN